MHANVWISCNMIPKIGVLYYHSQTGKSVSGTVSPSFYIPLEIVSLEPIYTVLINYGRGIYERVAFIIPKTLLETKIVSLTWGCWW